MSLEPTANGAARRPNIYDVADRAGVSHMTVSRVLNGHPSVREATRERVLAVISELNYARSRSARALATNRSMRIGAIIDNAEHYGPNSTLLAIEAAARESGYALSTYSVVGQADGIGAAVADLSDQEVDGLCVIAPRASSVAELRALSIDVPLLVVKEEPDEFLHTAAVDQHAGALDAVRHLIDLGHREILHVAGPQEWFDARSRTEAWRLCLKRAGLPAHDPHFGDWSSDSGYEIGRRIELGEATAVFVANDQMALGLIHALAERGIHVPDDVSVVGFDDLPEARHFLPPLTTVRQDFAALGRLVIEELIAAMEGQETAVGELIRPQLQVRASTAAPRQLG